MEKVRCINYKTKRIVGIAAAVCVAAALLAGCGGQTAQQPAEQVSGPVFGTIDAGFDSCVGIREDGTAVFSGKSNIGSKLNEGENIIQAAWRGSSLVALAESGAVWGESLNQWTEHEEAYAQIAGNEKAAYALKADGTVECIKGREKNENAVEAWSGIKAISIDLYAVGLKNDGTVVIAGDDTPDVSGWTDVVAVSTADKVVAALRADGTVAVALGDEASPVMEAEQWAEIAAISVGEEGCHIVGLKADGTVVAAGDNKFGECDVSDWTDMVAVSAGYRFTVGLKADGTVVAVGRNSKGQCDVSGWENIRTAN